MSTAKKASLSSIVIIVVMMVFPILALKLGGAMAGMALCFILFFLIDPLTVLCLGILSGTEIHHLFWVPPAAAVAFPICFSIAVGELVKDLFVYAGLYCVIGVIAMLGTHFGIRHRNSKQIHAQIQSEEE